MGLRFGVCVFSALHALPALAWRSGLERVGFGFGVAGFESLARGSGCSRPCPGVRASRLVVRGSGRCAFRIVGALGAFSFGCVLYCLVCFVMSGQVVPYLIWACLMIPLVSLNGRAVAVFLDLTVRVSRIYCFVTFAL